MEKVIVFYDNWCPTCKKIKKYIQLFDWTHKIQFAGLREEQTKNMIDIPSSQLEKRMHAINCANNNIVSGIDSVTLIASRLPIFIWIVPILNFMKFFGIGEKIYDFIANRRLIVPVNHCKDGKCKVDRNKA